MLSACLSSPESSIPGMLAGSGPPFPARRAIPFSVRHVNCALLGGEDRLAQGFGFPAGHGNVNYPLLMGETVQVSVTGRSYTLEWK